MSRRKVVAPANFWRNVEGLGTFRTEHTSGFERAIAKLQDDVLPLLRQHPSVGRLYGPGRPIIEKIVSRLGDGVLREALIDEYVMLYLVSARQIFLLSLRHGRELTYDFGD